jgi:hypothetical protein
MIAAQFLRLRKPDDELTQIAKDVWCTDGQLAAHCDSTEPGLVVYGMVLLNDLDLELHYRNGVFPLKPGDAYCIDAHQHHSAIAGGGAKRNGLFAVRVWDIYPGLSLANFVEQATAEPIEWMP